MQSSKPAKDLKWLWSELTKERYLRPPKPRLHSNEKEQGIALFMVVAAVGMLSLFVTEFTYIAQVNQKVSYDGLARLRAEYLALSGFKLSLIRLKAYQKVLEITGEKGGDDPNKSNPLAGLLGAAGMSIPKGIMESIWSFPLQYPIPTTLPGMTITQKDDIEKFQKASSLTGTYVAVIQSESSKFNLNSIMEPFVAAGETGASGSSGGTGISNPGSQAGADGETGSTGPAFEPEAARQALSDHLQQLYISKMESDDEFAEKYRNLQFGDLMNQIFFWADRKFDINISPNREDPAYKRAPYFHVSELRMIPLMEDDLYKLFAPNLTAHPTPGINVNRMNKATFQALVPGMSEEDISDFFEFRDNPQEDNQFKKADDFFSYLSRNISVFQGGRNVEQFKEDLGKKNIRIVTIEEVFWITVEAQVQNARHTIEAIVAFDDTAAASGGSGGSQGSANPLDPATGGAVVEDGTQRENPGLKITFMRSY